MESGLYERAHFRIAGDRGLLVEYGDTIDPAVNHKVRSMAIAAKNDMPNGVIEIIPTYRSILMFYDPSVTNPSVLKETLTTLEKSLSGIEIPSPKLIEIPICYGGDFGPDIEYVASSHNLTVEDVVQLHSEPEYLIYMVGFTPGFPFLGGLHEVLHTPRLETPRTRVPEGSVGIANEQTGIYPVASPGGWQLIGRTPIKLFAPERDNPILYQAGDRIKFKPISSLDYHSILQEEVK
ncbi:MAG: 5-oxoprolinase subunit PxpB [Desulfobacterales bacterium]